MKIKHFRIATISLLIKMVFNDIFGKDTSRKDEIRYAIKLEKQSGFLDGLFGIRDGIRLFVSVILYKVKKSTR